MVALQPASAPRSSRPFLGPGTTRYSQPRGTHGDRYWLWTHSFTGLEVASRPRLRRYGACFLLSGALRSAEIRSLKYHGKYHGEPIPDGLLLSLDELGGRENRRHGVHELPQVRIARDDALRAYHPGEHHEVVVPGVGRQVSGQEPS